jgi:hypothetical protein
VTFYDFSRRNLQTPQTSKQKTNPKQTHPSQQKKLLFAYQTETLPFKYFSLRQA